MSTIGYVYIVVSTNRNAMYVGVTANMGRRMFEHVNGIYHNSFTKRYRIKHLVHYETYPDIKTAIVREKEIKKWCREKKDILITDNNPQWKKFFDHKQSLLLHYE